LDTALTAVSRLIELAGRDGTVSVRAYLSRAGSAPPGGRSALLSIDPDSRTVHDVHGAVIELSRREFDLLVFLVRRPSRVFTRAQLLAQVWGAAPAGERTVDVHMRRLRMKLGQIAGLITTVRCVGYRFDGHGLVALRPSAATA
jgi:DNA-binding response OmpR family regulator